jgi:hypothetical protein
MSDYVKMPSIEEADIMSPVKDTVETIAAMFRERFQADIRGRPESEYAAIAQRHQREFYQATAPLMKAAGDALALTPQTWLVVEPDEKRS